MRKIINDCIYFQEYKNKYWTIKKEEKLFQKEMKWYNHIFQKVIYKIRKVIKVSYIALEKLNFNLVYKYSKDDIKWVITVPAIWNKHAKQFMRDCVIKAGMNDILISLESEAASLTMFEDPNIEDSLKEKGKIFMLIDANTYTVDINLFQIVDEKRNLKQLSPPLILNYDSMNINNEIKKY